MQHISLPSDWQLRAVGRRDEVPDALKGHDRAIAAVVPGCVHLDLMRANLIPDPYLDLNEALVQWVGRTDWEYLTTFEVGADALAQERVDLVCEGLDTVATIWINGVEVGRSENMHVEARFAIKEQLREGENAIAIRFDSAVHYARARRDALGDLPHANVSEAEPFQFIRKNACNFGWDWGPMLTTCGVWKPIRLEAWSVARIKSARPLVKVANEKVAVVDVEVEIETTDEVPRIQAAISTQGRGESHGYGGEFIPTEDLSFHHTTTLTIYFKDDIKLWWPIGYGEQELYGLDVEIFHEVDDIEGSLRYVDGWQGEIGLREVELDTSPDDVGAAWTVKINGKGIWCKGANWIPDDVFLTRAGEPQRLRERLTQAREAGMNMIRVWGGGIYETDDFYSLCDELGLLVWQDFTFACAAYPEDAATSASIEEEARFNVTRLSRHPSLVLWNGCNENIWGYFDWGWEAKLDGKPWGALYYFDVLPRVVAELDPTRPYWAGSPFSGSMEIHPNADAYGNKHMWDTWNDVNFTFFRRYSPRFASEFGHQAPPNFSTLARAIPADKRDPMSVSMLSHQKAHGGNEKLHARLLEHFAMPDGLDDWLYLTQLVQARAMTTACEWFRTRSQCRGALYWQLNDCWPVTSWAAIDGDGKPKPLYYATKRFFRERLLTIQPDGAGLALWAHNDSDESWVNHAAVALVTMDDEELANDGWDFHVAPRSLVKIATLDNLRPTDSSNHFLIAVCDALKRTPRLTSLWFFDTDKNLNYPEPKWTPTVRGNTLYIRAHTFIRDLYINVDRFGGSIAENGVTLLPGETWEVEITGADLSGVDFGGRPIVHCANWYGAK